MYDVIGVLVFIVVTFVLAMEMNSWGITKKPKSESKDDKKEIKETQLIVYHKNWLNSDD